MAKFCPECAHPIIDGNSQFCPKCGNKLPITSLKQQPEQPSEYTPPSKIHDFLGIKKDSGTKSSDLRFGIDIIDNTLNRIEKGSKSPPKKRSTLEWIAIGCGGFLLLIIVLAFIAGMAGNLSSASLATDKVYNKDLSSMALTINDLPTSWETQGTAINTNDHYDSEFIHIVGLTPYVVYQDITRNVTINDAKAFYLLNKGKITQFKVDAVNLGDEGYGYVTTDSSIVVFRNGNIIVTTQYGVGGFGASFTSLSINDAQQYAAIIADRIKS
jgi:hypothetical protein